MSKFNYDGPRQFKPISAWGYIGYSILFAIPIIGFILLIVFSISDRNINRRSYARSFFCWLLLAVILTILTAIGVRRGILDDVSVPELDKIPGFSLILSAKPQKPVEAPRVTEAPARDDAEPAVEQPEEQPTEAPEQADTSAVDADMVEVQANNKTVLIRKDFKDAMDKYEAFFDEYVDVLKSQDPVKLSAYMLKYAQTMEAFEKVEDDDLTDAEAAYYFVVQTRINQKLMSYQ